MWVSNVVTSQKYKKKIFFMVNVVTNKIQKIFFMVSNVVTRFKKKNFFMVNVVTNKIQKKNFSVVTKFKFFSWSATS